ncbi:PilZ domain-containing protein [Thaumasiovibrio subtropicus]|uniref:PilZ domain-containing protein n=1 Tax=Thaumasiovibrio subtropicus TaxID=1891207 RepID=UPI00131C5F45|nr:PilZ domain-containing protein [Thaumasiovibrio subtropicus]
MGLDKNKSVFSRLTQDREREIRGTEAMPILSCGAEFVLHITNALGSRFRCETMYLGTDLESYILLAFPQELSATEKKLFFNEGFRVSVKTESQKGEGALIQFSTQIMDVIHEPMEIISLYMPQKASIRQLRTEPRYEVDLKAAVNCNNRPLLINIHDLSQHGCCFRLGILEGQFELNQTVEIEVPHKELDMVYTLTGFVRSISRRTSNFYIGVEFDEQGVQDAKKLLAKLIYNGSKLIFKQVSLTK